MNKIKHLEMIEAITRRMAGNSFMLKGWTVTLVVAIFALLNNQSKWFLLAADVPVVMFWGLDSYYFRLERIYKYIYEKVRMKQEDEIDFDMRRSSYTWKKWRTSYFGCLLSITEMVFYFPLALVPIIIFFYTCHETLCLS